MCIEEKQGKREGGGGNREGVEGGRRMNREREGEELGIMGLENFKCRKMN